ncbi:MAG: hypothetical protein HZA50_09925 [Planctomycetes bacterium]|nr:hypothetical protein [Planctomycetota bacterium]
MNILLVAAALACGCGPRQPYVTTDRLGKGLVLVLTGIEGRSNLNEDICKGLNTAGIEYAVELYDWTNHLIGPLLNLQAYEANRRKAEAIANEIISYHNTYPGRPIFLIGQSGGGAMAVWAAEELPQGIQVEAVILLAASLSPNYNLDLALSNSRRGVLNFYSQRDWMILGVGTTFAGTMDREHTASAGKEGFKLPDTLMQPESYRKLFQKPWDPSMSRTGYGGGHFSSSASLFVEDCIAPLIRLEKWSVETIKKTLVSRTKPQADQESQPSSSSSTSEPTPKKNGKKKKN